MIISESKLRKIIREESINILREGEEYVPPTPTKPPAGYPPGTGWKTVISQYGKGYETNSLNTYLPGSNIAYYRSGGGQSQTSSPFYVKHQDGWWYFDGPPAEFNENAQKWGLVHSKTKDLSGEIKWENPDGSYKPFNTGPGPFIISRGGDVVYMKKGSKWGLDADSLFRMIDSTKQFDWFINIVIPVPSKKKGAFDPGGPHPLVKLGLY